MYQNFQEAIDYLLNLDNWEASTSIVWDTTNNHKRMQVLLELVENPQNSFKKIIVGGTNGKGTTSNMIAEVFKSNDLKVGTFNSPHITSIKERIRINRQELPNSVWVNAINKLRKIQDEFQSFDIGMFTSFEALTAIAVLIFAEEKVDYSIFEVGLGGRHDSTNSWDSDIAVLTRIARDHVHILGNSLSEITKDKVTIAKKK